MAFSPFERMMAGRYLRARKAEGFVSVIAGFSFLGIMLGVATLIIVMSVMNGFREELVGRILGLNGHLNVYGVNGPIYNYKAMVDKIENTAGVASVRPMVEGQVLVSVNGTASGAMVRGLTLDDFATKPILSTGIQGGQSRRLQRQRRCHRRRNGPPPGRQAGRFRHAALAERQGVAIRHRSALGKIYCNRHFRRWHV